MKEKRSKDKRVKKGRISNFSEEKILFPRKKFCRFCLNKVKDFDYKDIKRLERSLTERGKIISSRASGNCAKHQRMLMKALKRARFISLLPYVNK